MNSTFTMATYVCLSTRYIFVSLNPPHMCLCPLPTYGCLSTRYRCVFVHSPHMGVYPLTTYVSPRFLSFNGIDKVACSRSTTEGAIYGNHRICLTAIVSAHFHVSWLSDFIFYHKPYINRFTNHFSIHS